MKITKPVYIIGCPRSGTTLLFTILRASKELWSHFTESHYVWEKFLTDKRDPMFSMYLTENDYKESDREYLERKYNRTVYHSRLVSDISQKLFFNRFKDQLDPAYQIWSDFIELGKSFSEKDYRFLDKTPPNTYRVGYLGKAFPDAKFIYLTRDGATNISSLIEGWKSSGRFSFKFRNFYDYNSQINIKGYDGKVWKFTNPPGWEEYLNKSLEEVCAFQWLSAHQYAQEAFDRMNSDRCLQVKYEDLIANPTKASKAICDFIEIDYMGEVQEQSENLPVVSTSTKPDPNKWLKNKEQILNIADMIEDMQIKLGYPSVKAATALK